MCLFLPFPSLEFEFDICYYLFILYNKFIFFIKWECYLFAYLNLLIIWGYSLVVISALRELIQVIEWSDFHFLTKADF